MNWAILLPIIIRDGIPAAMEIWKLIQGDKKVSQEDWDRLLKLSQKTYDDYIKEARGGQ